MGFHPPGFISNVFEEMETVVGQSHVVVVGGGVAGITCASELAREGIKVTLMEKEAAIGGWVANYGCKATDQCNRCFVCVSDKDRERVRKRQDVALMTGRRVVKVGKKASGFVVETESEGPDGSGRFDADAIIFTTGFKPFDATQKGELGYGRYEDVVTGLDLERMLREKGRVTKPSDGNAPKKVAFIQCVGSRDESIGNLYCSKACCAYALRMARVIRNQDDESKISFFYMDIQPAGRMFDETLKACEDDPDFSFVRAIPSKVYQYHQKDGLMMHVLNNETDEIEEQFFDMIVLSVGMVPNEENNSLYEELGAGKNAEGFIDAETAGEGVFMAGTVTGPKDIERSVMEAKRTVLAALRYLEGAQK